MRFALDTYNHASLASYAKHNAPCAAILANYAACTNGTFHVHSNVDNTFSTFDDFNDFAFQCIEAETFGFIRDVHNGVIYVLDCTADREL